MICYVVEAVAVIIAEAFNSCNTNLNHCGRSPLGISMFYGVVVDVDTSAKGKGSSAIHVVLGSRNIGNKGSSCMTDSGSNISKFGCYARDLAVCRWVGR